MRISDWSSDVCSSDLHLDRSQRRLAHRGGAFGCETRREEVGGRCEIVAGLDRPENDHGDLDAPGCKRLADPFFLEDAEIGRAPCRGKVCQSGYVSVGAG